MAMTAAIGPCSEQLRESLVRPDDAFHIPSALEAVGA